METPTTVGVLRNALLLILRHPAFSLIHAIGMLALAISSLILPFLPILLTFSFAAILSTLAISDCLAQARQSTGVDHGTRDERTDLRQAT